MRWMDRVGNGCLVAMIGVRWLMVAVLGVTVMEAVCTDGFVHNMFEREQNIGHVVGGTFRSRATVQSANISIERVALNIYILNRICE